MRRLLFLVACAVLLGSGGVLPAAADDLPPPVFPTGLPGPSSVGNSAGTTSAPAGPTYVLTPGSKGTALPPPTTKVPRSARTTTKTKARTHPAAAMPRPAAAVGAPAALARPRAADGAEAKVLLAGAGALLMLVLTEFTRLDRRFRLRRPPLSPR